jgi:hypothetical protein
VLLSAQGMGQRREIKKVAKVKPAEYDLPFSTWSLSKLAEFLVLPVPVFEIAYTPTDSSWLTRIEAQFTALRYFALDGTDHQDEPQDEGG